MKQNGVWRLWAGCQKGIHFDTFRQRVNNHIETDHSRAEAYKAQAFPWLAMLEALES